jgi:hypothetical protein
MNGQENRKFKRYTTDSECEVRFDSKVIKGKVLDYSDGISIITKHDPALVKGTQVDIKILGTEIEFKAEAVWTEHRGFHLKAGFRRLGNLRGNLEHYRLADILIGINKNKKTGILEIKSGSFEKRILISNGVEIFASSTDLDDRLGELLIKRNKITREQFNQAFELVSKRGQRLGKVLISLGFLKQNDLVRAVKHQVEDIIVGLFNIENGTFEFKEGPIPTNEPITLKVSSANLVYKGIKKINNVALIKKICPPLSAVLNVSENPMTIFRSITLDNYDRQILSCVDGINTLKKILALSPSKNIETRKTIATLLSIGLIHVKEEDEAPAKLPLETLFGEPDDIDDEMEAVLQEIEDIQGERAVQESVGTAGVTDNDLKKIEAGLRAEMEKKVTEREEAIRSQLEKEIRAKAEEEIRIKEKEFRADLEDRKTKLEEEIKQRADEEIQQRESAAREKIEAETSQRVEGEIEQKEQAIRKDVESAVNARIEEEVRRREEELRSTIEKEGRSKVEEAIKQKEEEIRVEAEAEVRRSVDKVKEKSEAAVRAGVEDVRMKVEEEVRQIEKEIWEKAEAEIQQREADAQKRAEEELLVKVEEEVKKREKELSEKTMGAAMVQAQEEIRQREEEISDRAEENVQKRVNEVKANVEKEVSERVKEIKGKIEEEVRQNEEAIKNKLEEDVKERVNAEVVAKVENEVMKRAEEIRVKVEAELRQREEDIRTKIEQDVLEKIDDANAQVEEEVGRRIEEVKVKMEEEVRKREEEIRTRIEENVRLRVEEELMARIDKEVKEKVEEVKEKLDEIVVSGSRNAVGTNAYTHGEHDGTPRVEELAVSTVFAQTSQGGGEILMSDAGAGITKEHIHIRGSGNENEREIGTIQGDSDSLDSKLNRPIKKTGFYVSAVIISALIIGPMYYSYNNKSTVSSTPVVTKNSSENRTAEVSEEKNRLPAFNEEVLKKFLNK